MKTSSHAAALAMLVSIALSACSSPVEEAKVTGRGSADLGAAPACGTVLASIDDVDAYSNGECQTRGDCNCLGSTAYGSGYQCVELAQRYFATKFGGFPNVWPVESAWQMCDVAGSLPTSVHLRGSGYVPVHGDLAVLGNGVGDGHVAVVNAVSGGVADTVEQNSSTSGRGSVTIGTERCFIHANTNPNGAVAAPTAPTATADAPCAGVAFDSWYCGGHRAVGDATVLYECVGGQLVDSHQCTQGCVASDGANADACGEGGGGEVCNCHGTDVNNNAVNTTTCGVSVCGTDHQMWTCGTGDFAPTGGSCP